jgi:hypothetical protein
MIETTAAPVEAMAVTSLLALRYQGSAALSGLKSNGVGDIPM